MESSRSLPPAPSANGHAASSDIVTDETIPSTTWPSLNSSQNFMPVAFFPNGPRSLAGISLRSFLLGIAVGVCANLTILLYFTDHDLWRLPFFLLALATFHYLEFDMTARYNPTDAKISSFLFSNGTAYTIAHCTAIIECGLRWFLTSDFWPWRPTRLALWPKVFPAMPQTISIVIGLLLIAIGQTSRSLAMRTAGTNFNHIVQKTRKQDHKLVTNGIYAYCRHPSYFGFFWWGLGTQLVLGNHFCFIAYTLVLWKFFQVRIKNEEIHLIHFFGKTYLEYRDRTPVLIPFIA